MRRPSDEFMKQFQEKYGDLLLSYQDGMGSVQPDMGNPMLPASYANGNEHIDVEPTNEEDTGQTLWGESGYSKHHSFHAPDSFSPMIGVKSYEPFHDHNVSGWGANFYNNVGDIRSPLIQWTTSIPPILDKPIQLVPQNFGHTPDCFPSVTESQDWPYGDTHFAQAHGISTNLTHHNLGCATLDGVCQDIPTSCCSEQSEQKFDLATFETQVNENWPYGNREKFRYNVTLQAPTAMQQHSNEKPITYLNKDQLYSLTVADSTPPTKNAGLLKYKTFVHVSFEGEDQRSNPVASWQLWKEGRGLKEAHEQKSKSSAVEYVDLSQGCVRHQRHRQVQLEEASLNGFCVFWTADPTMNVYEAAILLKLNFVSTDFTRAKGIKGVPVRLCTKTEMLLSDDGNKTTLNEPEMCYSLVKVFRDRGAERKLWHDKKRISKRAEKLSKRITDREANANFASRHHNKSAINGRQFDIPPQKKRKPSISPRARPTSDEVLRAELATTVEVLSSARPVSVLNLRGNMRDGLLDNQHNTGAITAFEGGAYLLKDANVQVNCYSSNCQECPPKILKGSIRMPRSSPPPANHPSNAVACFYILFAQSGKQPQGSYYVIYLAGRTSLDLEIELAAKLRIDPCLITSIVWVNSKGLKVMVDDDMVQQLPEGQIMIANILEFSNTQMAPSSAKRSEVEVELVFQ